MSRMNIGRRTWTAIGEGTASSSPNRTARRASSDGGSPQWDPCHSPQGPRKPACTPQSTSRFAGNTPPELADVAEDAGQVLGVGPVVAAGEPVSRAEDHLQAIRP